MSLSISFTGKRILITGAARGLGKDLVSRLVAQNAIVFALSKTQANLDKLKEEYPEVHIVCVDLGDWNMTRKVVSEIGLIDVLINNGAVAYIQSFLDITPEALNDTMNINVKSVLNVSQIVAEGMIKAGNGGTIVNISSTAAKLYSRNISAYCASKAALDMLTKCLARELGHHQIRVNSINPTIFESDKTKEFLSRNPDGGHDFASRVPLKRIAKSEEIVNTVLFIMSDKAPMINGETIVIDGGFSAS